MMFVLSAGKKYSYSPVLIIGDSNMTIKLKRFTMPGVGLNRGSVGKP
jgi:hypothetical protein